MASLWVERGGGGCDGIEGEFGVDRQAGQYEVGNPQAVLDGDIDGFVEAGIRWRRSQ